GEAGVPERDEPRGRRHGRLADLLVQRLARVHVHVEPHEIEQLARTHRPPRAELHARVEILRRDTRLVEHTHAVVQQRDEYAIDDEPGRVVTADRMPAECVAEGVRRVERRMGGGPRAHNLHEPHQRRRVEEVHPHDAFGCRDRRRDLRHGERRRVRREHRVGPADPLELREQLLLRAEVLDDCLDHQIAVRKVGQLGRKRQPRERAVTRARLELTLLDLAREEVRDARLRALRQLERDLTPDGVDTRLDRELRDAGAHRAQADDADLHARESRRGPSSAIAAPATAISESDTVSPTPRARKPISGPFTTPPVYPAVATDAMPALEEIPGVAAATRNSAGTIAAQPAPTRANPTKPGTAEDAASA